MQVDQQRALAYHQAMAQLAALIPGAVYKPDPYRLVTLPDVICKEEEELDMQEIWPLMEQVLRQARSSILRCGSRKAPIFSKI